MHLEPRSYVTWFQRSFEMVVTTFSVSTKFFLECVEHDLGQSEFYTAEVITSSTCLISCALSGDSPNTQNLQVKRCLPEGHRGKIKQAAQGAWVPVTSVGVGSHASANSAGVLQLAGGSCFTRHPGLWDGLRPPRASATFDETSRR